MVSQASIASGLSGCRSSPLWSRPSMSMGCCRLRPSISQQEKHSQIKLIFYLDSQMAPKLAPNWQKKALKACFRASPKSMKKHAFLEGEGRVGLSQPDAPFRLKTLDLSLPIPRWYRLKVPFLACFPLFSHRKTLRSRRDGPPVALLSFPRRS